MLDSFDVLALANTGSLAAQFPQVEELGAANMSAGDDFDLLKDGRVEWENPLNADAVGDLADRKRLANTAFLTADNNTLENLDTLFVAFDDFYMHLDGITNLEGGDILLHLFEFQEIDGIHWFVSSSMSLFVANICFYCIPTSRSSIIAAAERTER